MRVSEFLLATVREIPADAEIMSHKLMIRAGMMRKNAAGIYTWLPLGFRVLRKIEKIVREEMDKSGAQEILMPAIQGADLWIESGRWNQYGDQLLKLKDRHKNDFCFGPTHEEVVTDLARRELRSYKQLPLVVYQIQMKFRDEIRPRFGVMRAREFLMKDAYSFHLDAASLDQTYQKMYQVYQDIFTRLGLKFRAVLGDSGNIGGDISHEFQVLAESGEDLIFFSDGSDYAANIEKAEALAAKEDESIKLQEKKMVDTPDQRTIAEVSSFLKIDPKQTVKMLLVKGNKEPFVAIILRGDHELHEIKVEKTGLIATPITFINEKEVKEITGGEIGFIGPCDLKIPVIVDRDAAVLKNFVCGANQNGKHFINVNWGRDLVRPEVVFDLRKVVDGDLSPDGKGKLKIARGIEVGHIFKLKDKYSVPMKATVLNAEGRAQSMQMGCYGIGVSRLVAAAIEQTHDERGIIWPDSIAPFQIALVPISYHQSYRVREVADKIYHELKVAGYEVLFDDRKERTGVIFADMDLIGIPHRVVISESGIDQGNFEYKHRRQKDSEIVPATNLLSFLKSKVS
jgi:prolyl-tRNA synthetase